MIGTGLARTYRAGQLMHLPVLFWNKTFNDKWGMELLLHVQQYQVLAKTFRQPLITLKKRLVENNEKNSIASSYYCDACRLRYY
jgi:hypothetical protein